MQGLRPTHVALLVAVLSAGFGAGRLQPVPASDSLETARSVSAALRTVSGNAAPAVVQVRALVRRGSRGLRALQEGSGVIVDASGVVVTNNHVVRGGTDFRVLLSSGRRVPASLVGRDPETDLAVLRIEGGGPFPALELDTSTGPQVGEIVLALGNPLGLGHSVTQGIVCGLGRSDLDIATYEDFIQTDAVINPGNSGGPLIDLDGEVVGINTAVGLASNGDAGIAFAIPSTMVAKVVRDILEHGEVVRGWLGVEMYWWFNPEHERGYDGVSQVKISDFPESSPAARAGLEKNDIILRIGKRQLISRKDLLTVIAETSPESTVDIEVWRAGATLTVPVTLTRREPLDD
jgi:S1-C subfamily serine protease